MDTAQKSVKNAELILKRPLLRGTERTAHQAKRYVGRRTDIFQMVVHNIVPQVTFVRLVSTD